MYTGKEKQNDRLIYSWQEFRCWKTSLYYSKFIIFLGIPIFVNFVDNVKPQNSITICHHIYIRTIAGDPQIYIISKIHFVLEPRKFVSTNLNEFTTLQKQFMDFFLWT